MKQPKRVLLFNVVPFLLIFFDSSIANGSQYKKVLNFHKFQRNQLHSQYQYAFQSCFSLKSRIQEDSTTMEIKHRDSCSKKTSHDLNKRLQERIILDNDQVQYLQHRIKYLISGEIQTLSDTQTPLSSGTRLEILNYVITLQLGGKNMTVIVDTGSDLTWVQCKPCKVCYHQQEPIFNPSTSLSYQSISCNTSACRSLKEATTNLGACAYNPSTCNYYVSYGDGSYTRGELATETLDIGKARVNNFVFGCGRSNKGLFGSVSGLMGLGKSDLSFVTQTSKVFGGVFSYCLPSTDAGESGSLTLGQNSSVYRNTTPISYTRMVQNPQLSSFYMLNLTGIDVGGVQIDASSGENGILIDSGTVITRLPPSIYKALKAEFVKQFSAFPSAPGFSILNTCFNLSSYKEVNIPTVRLQFEGNAELNVDVNGVFYMVKSDASQACLAFASLMYEDDIAIIGNYQQKNIRIVYDTKQSLVGFAEEKCSF
ncbi:aspartyl protease family protein At5g10770 [Beta vulgaris subsp. vulgaris]|uniref:aspartyl protease family protein At5g10770 n=1 Tax=Beta vulgaris subsp. vulgaris TaxID=3555 RepID=UPI00053F7F1D|nr:aspartyl protease family protein At5g10770 [Beta vulgaris subsp. vulgaris]